MVQLKKIISVIVVVFFIFAITQTSYGQTSTPSPTPTGSQPTSSKSSDLQKTINELQQKVSELSNQKKTLASQIAVMDSQIKLTQLRIDAKKQEIAILEEDIDTSNKKIDNLEGSLSNLTKVLVNRIVATYQIGGSIQPLQIVASSGGVGNYLDRVNYLKIIQEHDKKLIYETQQAKVDYANQKQIFEEKKAKVEQLKQELEGYTAKLDQDKKDKNALLIVTQNNEAVYQQKLQAALAEQAAISQIAGGGGNAVSVGPVKAGDVIAHVISGRSACSSGTHLHFEAHEGGGLRDPSDYLSSASFSYVDNDGGSSEGAISPHGSWSWPLHGSIIITQGYGMTPWARSSGAYGGGPHTGIDMYSTDSSAVYAVKDGTLYRGGIGCGGGQLLFAKVDHGDGTESYYLHVTP